MQTSPSIQTLRAFESAARHRSYTLAAGELNITHGAISHRIRDLETRQGVALFKRNGHRMELTAKGHELLVQVRQILNLIYATFPAQSSSDNQSVTSENQIVISTLPAFASYWLLKRLPNFREGYPNIILDLRVTPDLIDFANSDVQAAIRYGPGGWTGLTATKLCDEYLFPVCAPELAHELELTDESSLANAPLLRSAMQPWTPWFNAAGIAAPEPSSGNQFSDVGLMLQSAIAGEGIALARSQLVGDLLESGQLVRLSEVSVQDIYSYYLVVPADKPLTPALKRFVDWLGLGSG